ncbi:MAG: twin-arginine translocation signal domain-containing protein [bacterium]
MARLGEGPSIVGGQPTEKGRGAVGGQPTEKGRGAGPKVSVGIERVLYLAATDGTFKAALLEDRAAALEDRELLLLPDEQAILVSVPDGALASMIRSIRPPDHGRRRFMKAVAAASVAGGVVGVTLSSGCVDEELATGIRPQEDAAIDASPDADPPPDDAGS